MKKRSCRKFKSGAASFYVVAFSTLILVIVAASFAMAIVAEITRTANDDLSQSAYDAALAGVEDAKLAIINYRNCLKKGETYEDALSSGAEITCQDIVYWMNHPNCDMVAHILGRISKDSEGGEVLVEETVSSTGGSGNNMGQAYTCVEVKTGLTDYLASLSADHPYQVVRVRLQNVQASNIEAVRISWYSGQDDLTNNYSNVLQTGSGSNLNYRVAFQPLTQNNTPVPPTLAVQLQQTAGSFSFEQLINETDGNGRTDRATVYLAPTNVVGAASTVAETYIGVYDGNKNSLTANQLASTNNRAKNLPYAVYCPEDVASEFACTATLNLPQPIGGTRSDDTFMLVVSLPYGQPETDFALEFLCADGQPCGETAAGIGDDNQGIATLFGMQVSIDSTGRANNLYRRVEMRMEAVDMNLSYPFYAIELTDKDGSGNSLIKDMTVTSEYNFD